MPGILYKEKSWAIEIVLLIPGLHRVQLQVQQLQGKSAALNQPWSGSFQSASQSFKEKDSSISIFASYWLIQVLLAGVDKTVYLWSAQLRLKRIKCWGDEKQKWIVTLGFLGQAGVLLLRLVAIRGAQALLFPAAFELPQQWYFCGV